MQLSDNYQIARRNALKQEGTFIGTGMLFLTLLSQTIFSMLVLLLTLIGVIHTDSLTAADLGLGGTGYLLLYMSAYILTMGLPMIVAALLFRKRLQPFGPAKKIRPLTFFGAFLAGMALCMVANVLTSYLMAILESIGIPSPEMPNLADKTPLNLALNLLIFAVLPALLEEMVFRGCVLQTLRPYGDRLALLVSALLFSLMHGNILQIPFTFIMGLILGYVVVQTDNIWLAIAIHFGNNALSMILQHVAQYLDASAYEKCTLFAIGGVAVLGLICLIWLAAKNSPLTKPVPPSPDGTRTRPQLGVLFTSPAFLISVIVFILLTLFSVFVSLLGTV